MQTEIDPSSQNSEGKLRILICSGGTKVPIDGVRHIGNMSGGTFGSAIAVACLEKGHQVHFLHSEGSKNPFEVKYHVRNKSPEAICEIRHLAHLYDRVAKDYSVETFEDFWGYCKSIEQVLTTQKFDFVFLPVAVSDYGPVHADPASKISSDMDQLMLALQRLPKLIQKVKKWSPASKLVGFKLLVQIDEVALQNAADKQIAAADSEFCVGNFLDEIKAGEHKVYLFRHLKDGNSLSLINAPDTKMLAESLVQAVLAP